MAPVREGDQRTDRLAHVAIDDRRDPRRLHAGELQGAAEHATTVAHEVRDVEDAARDEPLLGLGTRGVVGARGDHRCRDRGRVAGVNAVMAGARAE